MDQEIITIKEVADYLRMSEFSIYRLLKEDGIPGFKVRGQWRFKKSLIDRWIESKHSSVYKGTEKNDNNRNS